MAEWFFEIRSGEIPGLMQRPAVAELERIVSMDLKDRGVPFESIKGFVGPCRLGAVLTGVAAESPATETERRGPRVDAPQQAIEGFVQSTGIPLEDLEVRETPKGTFYFAVVKTPAQQTKDMLPDIIRHLIYTLPWPKNMTWSTTSKTWIRPIQGGVCLFDNQAVEFDVSMNEEEEKNPFLVHFNDVTVGHRFMAPSPFKVKAFDDYVGKLNKAFVIIDQDVRKAEIESQLKAVCEKHDLEVKSDPGLLEEVTGLVEWPVCLVGTIDDRFMKLPPEVLRTTMRVHQRYFSTHRKDGSFAPHFIVVANINAIDGGQELITGNERVLKARLSDAAFFYENDLNKSLQEHGAKLGNTVFHADLGTLAQKQVRLVSIIDLIAGDMSQEDVAYAKQAASICKADLMTEMVYEFPELQGIMGSYYAKHDGYHESVSQALYYQYSPKGPGDDLPQNKAAQLLALADRFDNLVGFFSVGLKPTGSKDPFALRRSALGIIRYLETGFSLSLRTVFTHILDTFNGIKNPDKAVENDVVISELSEFIKDRLRVYWRDQGIEHRYVDAVLEKALDDPLCVVKQRLDALVAFGKDNADQAENLFAGYKRAVNILKKESVDVKDTAPHLSLFDKPEEKDLLKELQTAESNMLTALENQDYVKALSSLAPLRPHVDAFFDNVQVNDDRAEIRENRLKLLGFMRQTFERYADFSKL